MAARIGRWRLSLRGSRRRRLTKQSPRRLLRSLRFLAMTAVLIVCIFLVYYWFNNFFKSSKFFNVSKIELVMKPFLKEALSFDFYGIPRRCNIFQLDIDRIGIETQKRHPEFKSVVIARKPPNVISIRIEYKDPVAFVKAKNHGLAPISGDGVLLPEATAEGKALPVLKGEKLSFCFKFLEMARSSWLIESHRIDIIDASNIKNISIFLENGLEVMVGDGSNLKEKFAVLKGILQEPAFDFSKIKYIDMRFSDVIIAPKLTKS